MGEIAISLTHQLHEDKHCQLFEARNESLSSKVRELKANC